MVLKKQNRDQWETIDTLKVVIKHKPRRSNAADKNWAHYYIFSLHLVVCRIKNVCLFCCTELISGPIHTYTQANKYSSYKIWLEICFNVAGFYILGEGVSSDLFAVLLNLMVHNFKFILFLYLCTPFYEPENVVKKNHTHTQKHRKATC